MHNPNGFVIRCIVKANNRFRESYASHVVSVGSTVICPKEHSSKTTHEDRDSPCIRSLSQVSIHKSKTSDVVDVSESFPPMPEKSPTTPMADWDEKSENYKGTIAMPASKKKPKKQYKSTTVKAALEKSWPEKTHIQLL